MAITDILSKLIICQYCNKTFKTEQSLISHKCKVQEKYELGKTREGLLARQVYTYWLKKQRRKVPEYDAFINSKLFTHFYKFACFYYVNAEQQWEPYIDVMIEQKITPNNWTNHDIVQLYINARHNVSYENIVLSFIEKCLDDETYIFTFTTLSTTDLLSKIYDLTFPVTFLLMSSTFKQQVRDWSPDDVQEFDAFCVKLKVDQIMKNTDIVNSTKQTLQYFNLT